MARLARTAPTTAQRAPSRQETLPAASSWCSAQTPPPPASTASSPNPMQQSTPPNIISRSLQLACAEVPYVIAKQRDNVLDYDDLLLYWSEAVQIPGIAAQMRADFDHILVDEYQDTNRLQAAVLLALAPDGAGLTVVGDDAQSIYAFRAATVRNI